MKINILLIAAFLLIAGCDNGEDRNSKESRKQIIIENQFVYITCIDGVTYYMHGQGITIALNTESKIIPCIERQR